MRRLSTVLILAALLATGQTLQAGEVPTNIVPNPSFERGTEGPSVWGSFAVGGAGWAYNGAEGERCVSVTGLGEDAGWWAPKGGIPLEPNRLYHLSYWVKRSPDARGGTAIAGPESVNRDQSATTEWQEAGFSFRTPDRPVSTALFRVGEWHVKGTVFFDNVVVTPAASVERHPPRMDFALGRGETVEQGVYRATHDLGGPGSTDFRCLDRFTNQFNTDRWVFDGPGEVVYRHGVGRLRQTEPEVEVQVSLLESGRLLVEASADGQKWVPLGEVHEVTRVTFAVPSELLPTREMWVRLRTEEGASLQVNSYTYRAKLPEAGSIGPLVGDTSYLAIERDDPSISVDIQSLGSLRPEGDTAVEAVVTNRGERRSLSLDLMLERDGASADRSQTRLSLSPGSVRRVTLPYLLKASGRHSLTMVCTEVPSGKALWQGRSEFMVSPLYDARGGGLLSRDANVALWWCEPERKVSRRRPAPSEGSAGLRLELAGNEYEAAQLVLTPSASGECAIASGDLMGPGGARIPAGEIEIRTVGYVFTGTPTDELGARDEWPDPLPIEETTALEAGRNQPFWVSVHVPPGTPGGDYRGELSVTALGRSYAVPLVVHVWGFELPKETHLRSGFGLSTWNLARYQNLESDEDREQVRELYLRDFAAHRVAPFSVGRDIGVAWTDTAGGWPELKLDYAGFDEDAHFALSELGFNGFRLDLEGLGGGSFYERRLGKIGDLVQGTPEHERAFTRYAGAVQAHLARQGWLEKAYVYWFDEPDEKDYPFVREGMDLIHRGAPKLKRLLTEQPDPRLYGSVDIWCLPTYTLDQRAMRAPEVVDDEFWWYLCTAPKAPYFGLFIDHWGTEMRLWGWESWKYDLQGLLVWQTTYWTSEAAYPRPAVQNPWTDPMSWQSWYGAGNGERRPWGNGDGRFLYPPNREPGVDASEYVEGPVPSMRWELLRDGIEDYEYLWLLRAQVDRLKAAGAPPASYAEAAKLLDVPPEVCASLTDFSTMPEPIHAQRRRVAEAIEGLRGM